MTYQMMASLTRASEVNFIVPTFLLRILLTIWKEELLFTDKEPLLFSSRILQTKADCAWFEGRNLQSCWVRVWFLCSIGNCYLSKKSLPETAFPAKIGQEYPYYEGESYLKKETFQEFSGCTWSSESVRLPDAILIMQIIVSHNIFVQVFFVSLRLMLTGIRFGPKLSQSMIIPQSCQIWVNPRVNWGS